MMYSNIGLSFRETLPLSDETTVDCVGGAGNWSIVQFFILIDLTIDLYIKLSLYGLGQI